MQIKLQSIPHSRYISYLPISLQFSHHPLFSSISLVGAFTFHFSPTAHYSSLLLVGPLIGGTSYLWIIHSEQQTSSEVYYQENPP